MKREKNVITITYKYKVILYKVNHLIFIKKYYKSKDKNLYFL